MHIQRLLAGLLALGSLAPLAAQEPGSFSGASAQIKRDLDASLAELSTLRQQIADEKIPLGRELRELEAQLTRVREEARQKNKQLDRQSFDVTNLTRQIKQRKDEASYISNLLGDYVNQFESRLHITELPLFEEPLTQAKDKFGNDQLTDEEIHTAQAAVIAGSVERLHDSLGGTKFEGTAVDENGRVASGSFVLVGPAAIFRSEDGTHVGTAEQRLGSLEPRIMAFSDPQLTAAASTLVQSGAGNFPLDPSLGDAHTIAAIQDETLLEELEKGGTVIYPIVALASAALLVALYKWFSLLLLRKPSKAKIAALLDAVENHDRDEALDRARAISGPVGRMLTAGVRHIDESRELIEEVMYETVLTTRLKVNRFLPFIAISAASAPLLGLLGTVTGIIATFQLITVFGSSDVKTLSGGISEALITTKFGLVVAIPSLLLHAYLSRKARGVIGSMERAAVAFVNQVSKSSFAGGQPRTEPVNGSGPEAGSTADASMVRAQVREILGEMLGPLALANHGEKPRRKSTQAS